MRRQDFSPSDDELPVSDLAPVDLEAALRQRASPRKRLAQGTGIGLIALITLLLFTRSAPQPGTTPVITSIIPDSIVIRSSVTNGTIVVNGQVIGNQQIVGTLPIQAHLRQGKNIITLNAPPFRPHSCQIDWPSQGTNTPGCTFYFNAGLGAALEIALTAPDIPDFIQSQLQTSVNSVIASMHASLQVVVPAGQYFLTGANSQGVITSVRAATPLNATLTFVPLFDEIAGGPIQNSLPNGDHEWNVEIGISQSWQFTTPSGQLIGVTDLPYDHETVSINYHYSALGIHMEDNTEPFVIQQLQNLICDGIYQQLDTQLGAFSQSRQWVYAAPVFKGIEGCEIQLTQTSFDHPPTPPAAGKRLFLYRFGVLLAVDSEAHQLLPVLPVAPPAEVAAFER